MPIEILIVETRGSAPREPAPGCGWTAARIHGSIGGGNLEYTALKIAREMLLSGENSGRGSSRSAIRSANAAAAA